MFALNLYSKGGGMRGSDMLGNGSLLASAGLVWFDLQIFKIFYI